MGIEERKPKINLEQLIGNSISTKQSSGSLIAKKIEKKQEKHAVDISKLKEEAVNLQNKLERIEEKTGIVDNILLELGTYKDESVKINEGLRDASNKLKQNEASVKSVKEIIVGVVVVVMGTFLSTYVLISLDHIKEKDLYLQYNVMQTNYSQRVSDLEGIVNKQLLESNNLKHELEILNIKKDKDDWLEKILYQIKQEKISSSTPSI